MTWGWGAEGGARGGIRRYRMENMTAFARGTIRRWQEQEGRGKRAAGGGGGGRGLQREHGKQMCNCGCPHASTRTQWGSASRTC